MKKYILLTLVLMLIICIFAGCADNEVKEKETTTEITTAVTTVETTEETTEKETEEDTTKAPETTKPKPQPTQPKPTQPKPTEPKPTQPKPTEPKPTQPSGGGTGGIIWDDFDKGPDTDHVGGESSDEVDQAVQDSIDKNGWDVDWELN